MEVVYTLDAGAAGFEPTPAVLETATLVLKTSVLPLHQASNLCYTKFTIVQIALNLVCTCSILNMALYSLLNFLLFLVLATSQPRGQPLGLDHSPKPLTVDFVKLCGLRIVSVSSNFFKYI